MLKFNEIVEHHNRTKFTNLNFIRRHTRDYIMYCIAQRHFQECLRSFDFADVWSVDEAFEEKVSTPLSAESLKRFTALSLGRRTLNNEIEGSLRRVFASAGNFQPLEAYFITNLFSPEGHVEVAHLCAHESKLHIVQSLPVQQCAPFATVVLTSVPHKSQTKYGYRGWRFSQIDIGHAWACLQLAAGAMNWQIKPDQELRLPQAVQILGIESAFLHEPEIPVMVFNIEVDVTENEKTRLAVETAEPPLERMEWSNLAASLHLRAHKSELMGPRLAPEVFNHTHGYFTADRIFTGYEKNTTSNSASKEAKLTYLERKAGVQRLVDRRSQRLYGSQRMMTGEKFWSFLQQLHSNTRASNEYRLVIAPFLHTALYVRNVEGVRPGLYVHLHDPSALPLLKANTHLNFLWQAVHTEEIENLFLLKEISQEAWPLLVEGGPYTEHYNVLIFNLAALEKALHLHGASAYPQLLWECGRIGQWIYWSSQAQQLKACGVGGYLDDKINVEELGCRNFNLQVLGAYTVGV